MCRDVADEAQPLVAWVTSIRPASSPESPTAYEPCWLSDATISRFTLPTSAIRAMSTVSASVTRRPSRNSGSLPSRAHEVGDLRSAAVHHHRVHPHQSHEHDVLGEQVREPGSSIAWPPYLMTTVRPLNSRMYGQRLGEDRAPCRPRPVASRRRRPSSPRVHARSRRAPVLVDVRVRQVGEEHRCASRVAGVQVALDVDLVGLHRRRERVGDAGSRRRCRRGTPRSRCTRSSPAPGRRPRRSPRAPRAPGPSRGPRR